MHDPSRAAGDTTGEPEPESKRRVSAFDTCRLDEAQAALGQTYYPHRLDQLTTDPDLTMSLRTVRLGPLTLGRLSYGAEVSLDFGELENAYHVSIPLSGRVETQTGRQTNIFTPERACIYLPHQPTRITRWSADGVQYGIKFDRDYLEAELRALLGRPARTPVTFDPVLDLSSREGASWLALVRTLTADLDEDHSLLYNPLMSGQLVNALITGLLLAAKHEHRDLLVSPAPAARPRTIKLALDAMHAYPEEAWTVRGLAELVGVSVRTLQDGFARYVGISPVTYLRDLRLERAHQDLIQADARHDAVADVAYRWGFRHLGRFAADYRRRYGQSPSQTLATT
ncbi:AraC family transcriptional regulator (plasmid) [Rhodococcus opacus]|uniref:AraC family transcriptional regulator n=1 Tax=Rhodococcus opacus TaxID=37919 RepID=UPI0034D1F0FB